MNEDILKVIDSSMFVESEKQLLRDLLNKEGDSEAFYRLFNDLIIKYVHSQGKKYLDIVKQFEAESEKLELTMLALRDEQEKSLDQKLLGVPVDDFIRRTELLDEHYAALDKIAIEHEEKLKQLSFVMAVKLL